MLIYFMYSIVFPTLFCFPIFIIYYTYIYNSVVIKYNSDKEIIYCDT